MVELLVSMIVFSIAVVLAFSAVIIVMQKSAAAQRSADAQSELRLALAQIDRQVRSGNVLFSPAEEVEPGDCVGVGAFAGTCMRIYTQSNGDQKCVQWQVLADPAEPGEFLLRSRSWDPLWASGGGPVEAWGVVARGLHYEDGADPATVEAGDTPPPFTLSSAISTGVTPYGDRMLVVHLESLDTRRDHPIAIDSSITGRNTSYGYSSGQCSPVPPA
jgi:type II secretory pathway pseudopilin PulG